MEIEARVRDRLADKLQRNGIVGVRTEAVCECGRADIVTVDTVIEVKRRANWKHALGQVLVYANAFNLKHKRVHLFDDVDACDDAAAISDTVIIRACAMCGVSVTFEKI